MSLQPRIFGGPVQIKGLTSYGTCYLDNNGQVQTVSPGTSGQVLTSNGSSAAPSFQAAKAPVAMIMATDFAASGRFSLTTDGSGTNTFNSSGYTADTTSAALSEAGADWLIDTKNVYLGSPTFSCHVKLTAVPATCDFFFGLSGMHSYVLGGGIAFDHSHIGFKIVNGSLYATQADQFTAETASSALLSVAAGDTYDFIVVVNGTSGATYYYRKNGGSLSSGTTLTGNFPTTSDTYAGFYVSNHGAANDASFIVQGASYQR